MYCPQCGTQHSDDALFCSNCGLKFAEKEPIQDFMAGTVPPSAPATGYSKKAIAGFVLSLVGMFCMGLILGILGIIFSRQGMRECNENPTMQGRGLATAGLIISILDIVGWAISIVFTVFYIIMLGVIL